MVLLYGGLKRRAGEKIRLNTAEELRQHWRGGRSGSLQVELGLEGQSARLISEGKNSNGRPSVRRH